MRIECTFNPDPHVHTWYALVSMRIGLRSGFKSWSRGQLSERLRNVKARHAGANSTQCVGLVERSLLLSRSCFRSSRAQLNNKRMASKASVNVGHFVARSSCVTISTYNVHCPRISKTSVNMIDVHSMRFQFVPLDAHSIAHQVWTRFNNEL